MNAVARALPFDMATPLRDRSRQRHSSENNGAIQMKHLSLSAAALLVLTLPAMAGLVVPLPLAGAVGPIGLAALAVGYGAFRLIKKLRCAR